MNRVKKMGLNFTQTAPFILTNTIIFVPYLLFLSISTSVSVETTFPVVLFYCCRMTGIFLVKRLPAGLTSNTLLMMSLLLGCVGAVFGVIGAFFFPCYSIAGIFLGLSAAWLTPANVTVNLHEKQQGFVNMKGKKYIFALLLLIILGCTFLLPGVIQLTAVFAYYTLLYICAYHTVKHYPQYDLDFKDSTQQLIAKKEAVLFVLFFSLLLIIRSARLLVDIRIYEGAVLASSLLLLVGGWLLVSGRKDWRLPSWLNLLTFFVGMCLNFLLLFGTFYVRAVHSNTEVVTLLYLPYMLGKIGSLLFKNKLLKLFPAATSLQVYMTGSAIGLLLLLLPPIPFPIGILVISFFVSATSSHLNQVFYQTESLHVDQRIIAKYTIQSKGSICHQGLLLLTVWVLMKVNHVPLTTFLQLTGRITHSSTGMLIMHSVRYLSCGFFLIMLGYIAYVGRKKQV